MMSVRIPASVVMYNGIALLPDHQQMDELGYYLLTPHDGDEVQGGEPAVLAGCEIDPSHRAPQRLNDMTTDNGQPSP